MIKFEWDTAKATSNRKKHGVSFEEAQSVFYDEFAVQFFDEDNSVSEAVLKNHDQVKIISVSFRGRR